MASPSCVQFIDQALSSHTPFPLSYTDPQQKWLIRKHLLAILDDHPAFVPSFGTFMQDDGTAAHLLCIEGQLRPSSAVPPVPLIIWLHKNHPFMAPIVQVSAPVRRDHPFVSLSGLASCPYLETWAHPGSSLSNLARNLSRLFSRDHPLTLTPASSSSGHPSLMSRREALDRLAGSLHYDLVEFRAKAEEEVDALAGLRAGMVGRARRVGNGVAELEEERRGLRRAVAGLAEQADAVVNFLRVNSVAKLEAEIGGDKAEEAFEAVRGRSAAVLELVAAEKGVEDVMYALEKAVGEGVVSIDVYIKQVRLLAREQFFHRAKLVQLRASAAFA